MELHSSRLWKWVASSALAALILVATAGMVVAFNPQPEPPGRWVLGLTNEETASLTAVNTAEKGTCEVSFELRDADGRTLATETFSIRPGTFASLLYPPDPIHPPDPVEPGSADEVPRLRIRGLVTPLTKSCELATTLEIFGVADGRTTVAVGDMISD